MNEISKGVKLLESQVVLLTAALSDVTRCQQCGRQQYKSFMTPDQQMASLPAISNLSPIPIGGAEDSEGLGDAKYGVQVSEERLELCTTAWNTRDKLALNLLELLVTKVQCQTLSIYGQAKGKTPMDDDKRRALISYIFMVYPEDKLAEQKAAWDVIVKKLNDKIRAIKNKRYKIQ